MRLPGRSSDAGLAALSGAGIARESWLGHAKGRPDEDAYCRPCRLLLETYDRLASPVNLTRLGAVRPITGNALPVIRLRYNYRLHLGVY